jgi:hypothetical protein
MPDRLFRNVGMNGGDIAASRSSSRREAGNKLILTDAARIGALDEGLDVQARRPVPSCRAMRHRVAHSRS